jgi:hypothetical protein
MQLRLLSRRFVQAWQLLRCPLNPAQEAPMARNAARNDGVEGEGSYTGSKNYNQRTKKFVKSGKVEEAARKAKPKSEKEAREMEEAERIGKKRAKR